MKTFFILFIFMFMMLLLSCRHDYHPQTGDLFFMDSDCGSFCEAIKKVTYGVDGTHPSHVGVVYINHGKTYVIEADTKGVVKTPVDSFLNRSLDEKGHPRVFVGRLKEEYLKDIPQAINRMLALLGKPYDFAFDINNDCYYCSELLYKGFLDNAGKPIFKLEPMTFNDPDTKKIFPVWEDYFKKLGIPVPEGKPGLNPGGISRSDKIDIVYRYY
ncbi:MAG TPA: YiiX/YebB-like N1pC/P60 family cysteine hydrolase [Bacteroidales bacterium]